MSEEKSENTHNKVEISHSEQSTDSSESPMMICDNVKQQGSINHTPIVMKSHHIYKALRIIFSIGFIVFTGVFLNEVLLEPYRTKLSIVRTRDLYHSVTAAPAPTQKMEPEVASLPNANQFETNVTSKPTENVLTESDRDEKGRLLKFKELLDRNEDVKGWITIPDTNIDYVVLQSSKEDPEYYLTRDIDRKELKAGSLFLDYKSSLEEGTQNLVIHGHNMSSTDNMFHYLMNFKELDYYKERPIFTFDSIYQKGQWKIFAIFITNGTSTKEPLFNYTLSSFENASEFLNFIYQLRIRSIYQIDTVDIKENDQILTLSTCSYEVKNYRTVIVSRKIREGEAASVDVDSVTINPNPLYPGTWYYRYGGKAPKLTETFEEALDKGEINWYKPVE